MYAWYAPKPEESSGHPGTEVTYGFEWSRGCWEQLNTGTLTVL